MATSTIIGSANMELEQAFRIMALELGQQLSQGECQQIAYVSSCVPEPAPPGYDYRLYVFSTLESRGQIGPLKLDFIEELLVHIGRKDLLSIIAKYKRKPIYKEMHNKKKPKGKMKQKKNQTMQSTMTTDSTQYEEMYACFLTQYSTIALRMRSALESNDVTQMKYAFSSIANDGDAIACMLQKKLSIHVGVNRDSSSSRESSGMDYGNSLFIDHPHLHFRHMYTLKFVGVATVTSSSILNTLQFMIVIVVHNFMFSFCDNSRLYITDVDRVSKPRLS